MVARVFHRLLALLFLNAFLSLGTQVDVLIGSRGLLPIAPMLEALRQRPEIGLFDFPTLFWWNASDALIQGGIWIGVLLALVALAAALVINLVRIGPNLSAPPRFDHRVVLKAYTRPALRLANLGYLGHMWELYAMWAWVALFLRASFEMYLETAVLWSRLATFAVIGVGGALGAVLGGLLADRIGRTALTMGAMASSGTCAIVIGFLFGAAPWLVFSLAFLWGMVVVADSAQFSASIAELSEPGTVGTMLTMQTCVGFMLTLATVHLVPPMVDAVGWRFAFAPLAIGPFFGVWAMARLRRHPESVRIAGGRR